MLNFVFDSLNFLFGLCYFHGNILGKILFLRLNHLMANCAHVEEIKDVYFEYLMMRELFECILELGLLSTQISPKWVFKFVHEVSWLVCLIILLFLFRRIYLFMLSQIVNESPIIFIWVRNCWQIDFYFTVNCLRWKNFCYRNRYYLIWSLFCSAFYFSLYWLYFKIRP